MPRGGGAGTYCRFRHPRCRSRSRAAIGRLSRLRRLWFQRQDAAHLVFVRIYSLLVLLDLEPDARRLEQENLGVVHLFVDTKGDAQILQGLAADRLCLFVGMRDDDPLEDQAALQFSSGNLPLGCEVITVTGLWLLDAGLDDLRNILAARKRIPRVAFLRCRIEGFWKFSSHS